MMRLNRIHWLEQFGAHGWRFKHSKRIGPSWALINWFRRHGIADLHPDGHGFVVTQKGKADLAKAIGEQRDHGTYLPRRGR